MSIYEIAKILQERDGVSYNEAMDAIERCQEELNLIVEGGGSYDEAEDCVAYWLGLEPDYLMTLLDY